MSLSLGRTEHDTELLAWTGVGTAGNGIVTVVIPDGVDTWVKLRATNNGSYTHNYRSSVKNLFVYHINSWSQY